jgi:hypothetical protein
MTTSRADELMQALRALSGDECRRVLRQVAGGRLEQGAAPALPAAAVIGLFSDAPELMTEVAEDAMAVRERDPLRFRGE